jgi:hypothetical protein
MRTALILLLCACAANAALYQRMGLRRFSSGSASAYGSGYQSGYTSGGGGNTGGTATTGKGAGGGDPGGVNTATAYTLTQTFTLDIVASTYTAGSAIRRTTEVTLLKLMDLFDATKSARNYAKDGCMCTTSASAARRAAKITATTKVTPAQYGSAKAGANAFWRDPTLFASKFNEAKTLLGTTVAVPTVSGVAEVTATGPLNPTTSGVASTSVSVFALIAALGLAQVFPH